MSKIPFQITAAKVGKVAEIRIVGYIGWSVDAESFRREVDALVADGCTEAHLYINSGGGSCFDAEEIVNILHNAFGDRITGEGGAIVASAATYISTRCKRFEMPENGQFMVHRPTTYVSGNIHDIRSGLKLLQSIEDNYYKTFEDLATNKEDFKQKWEDGDNWMTAKEAKDAGFITHVKEPIKIDRETQDMIQACANTSINNNNNNTIMKIENIAIALGLDASATEAEITARLSKAVKAEAELVNLKKQVEAEKKAAQDAKVHELLEAAIKEKRITVESRGQWEELFASNFDATVKALEAIKPIKKLSDQLNQNKTSAATKETYNGKTFEQLRDESSEDLKNLMENDMDKYNALYQDYLTRNKLQ
ncbi:Clp protease ClpP [Porphyromonas levii]|uniref:Clp protease ClpP n=1 Tax=Porphyromonas levii TaxID=28114 RepID=UPI001B8AD2B8|nr:Clp protease ClpP [Porphyromonas levii]MBR8759269.1 ATP-dependent Clp protease proteolytic subunit [Porphyromonas levii]